MKQVATEAIVMGRIDFGEADRILTMLTSSHGKLSVLAKGVRKPKSRLAGGVELFSVSDIVYFEGKSDIKTLVSAQLKTNYGKISQDITRSMIAYDVLKYTNLFTESVCEDSYFVLVRTVFEALENNKLDPAAIWVWFGVKLLEISGHGINTHSDASDNPLKPTDHFSFDYQNMAFQPAQEGLYDASHIKVLRLCQRFDIAQLMSVGGVEQAAGVLQKLITDSIKYSN